MKTWLQKINGAEFKIMRLNDAPLDNTSTTNHDDTVKYLRTKFAESIMVKPDVENLMVVALSTRKYPIGFEVVSNGTLDTLLTHPREIFKAAIVLNAACIIVAHNHPSGDPSPSEADIKITRDLMRAGQLLKIEVVDHIILGRAGYNGGKGWCSLRELGYFSM